MEILRRQQEEQWRVVQENIEAVREAEWALFWTYTGGAAIRAIRAAGRLIWAARATPNAIGKAGEAAVRAAVDIGPKVPIQVAGRTRIPDGLTNTVLSEVKNVQSLSYTQQLRDFASFAQQTGRQFHLYVRPNTQLSGPLTEAVQAGQIHLRFIP